LGWLDLHMAKNAKETAAKVDEYTYGQRGKGYRLRKLSSEGMVAGVIVLVLFGAIVVFLFYIDANSERAIQAQADLETEFHSIPRPSQAVPFDYYASHKMQHALVTEKYRTTLSDQEIREYYDDHLTEHGWKFLKEEPLYDWWRDLGGKTLYYRKGNYTAALEFQGQKADSGYAYSLGLSWGLH
jgi:hypothetical protein